MSMTIGEVGPVDACLTRLQVCVQPRMCHFHLINAGIFRVAVARVFPPLSEYRLQQS